MTAGQRERSSIYIFHVGHGVCGVGLTWRPKTQVLPITGAFNDTISGLRWLADEVRFAADVRSAVSAGTRRGCGLQEPIDADHSLPRRSWGFGDLQRWHGMAVCSTKRCMARGLTPSLSPSKSCRPPKYAPRQPHLALSCGLPSNEARKNQGKGSPATGGTLGGCRRESRRENAMTSGQGASRGIDAVGACPASSGRRAWPRLVCFGRI